MDESSNNLEIAVPVTRAPSDMLLDDAKHVGKVHT